MADINLVVNTTNRGTGAGGANTNRNGLPYEALTDLKTEYQVNNSEEYYQDITFNGCSNVVFKQTQQSKFFKAMAHAVNTEITKAHGCKRPDQGFIREDTKTIFIIEKKFQKGAGSICEKIQTPHMKLWQYGRTFPEYTIVYIYSLSDWFKTNCVAELEYLEHMNYPVFWGNSETYKKDIIDFIINY